MACGNKGKLRNMGHGLANFIVRQHKNSKIDNKKSKKNKDVKESKTTTTKVNIRGQSPEHYFKRTNICLHKFRHF